MSREHLDAAALAKAVVDGKNILDNEHLFSCGQCRDELADLQAGLARLGRRSREAAPRSGSRFVWPQAGQPARASSWSWLWSPAAGAMAMVLLLAVVWMGLRGDSAPPPPLSIALQMRELQPWSEIIDPESDRLGGFAGFLVAENSTWQDQDFLSAGDDDFEAGAEGVIPWPGVL